jgi:hypothetical protein
MGIVTQKNKSFDQFWQSLKQGAGKHKAQKKAA